MPEMFSSVNKPEPCRRCQWRYRCGGADCSVIIGAQHTSSDCFAQEEGFQLYCAPRKALFEEQIWDFARNYVAASVPAPRELIDITQGGVSFIAAESFD